MPIREATVADARTIAEVHVEGWSWGYRGLLPDEVIDGLGADVRERQWVEGFTDRWREGDGCLLWEDARGALGFVAFGPATDEHAPPPPGAGEVFSIYLRREAAGSGIGRELFRAAERRLRDHGFRSAVLWVLAPNIGSAGRRSRSCGTRCPCCDRAPLAWVEVCAIG